MKTIAFFLFLGFLISETSFAQHGGRRDQQRQQGQGQSPGRSNPGRSNPGRREHFQRHTYRAPRPFFRRHPRYHRSNLIIVRPRRARMINVLPPNYITFGYGGGNYFFHDGWYYRNAPGGYALVAAPFGLRIRVLPMGYHRIMVGPAVRFYYMGTFYRQVDEEYETIEPEVGAVVPELPEHNVEEVTINGKTYYEYDNVLYKPVVTKEGTQYEVVGKLDD